MPEDFQAKAHIECTADGCSNGFWVTVQDRSEAGCQSHLNLLRRKGLCPKCEAANPNAVEEDTGPLRFAPCPRCGKVVVAVTLKQHLADHGRNTRTFSRRNSMKGVATPFSGRNLF